MTSNTLLGAVLAGGQSRRFGSDKAVATIDGKAMIDLALASLRGWCDAVVIVGREAGPAPCVPDWPGPGLGPLAGLAGALRHAAAAGYDAVLVCGVDSPGLPDDLPGLLTPGPACLVDQPVIGLWPVSSLPKAEAILLGQGRRSMLAFAEAAGARLVRTAGDIANVNFPEDIERLRAASQAKS